MPRSTGLEEEGREAAGGQRAIVTTCSERASTGRGRIGPAVCLPSVDLLVAVGQSDGLRVFERGSNAASLHSAEVMTMPLPLQPMHLLIALAVSTESMTGATRNAVPCGLT